MIRTKGEAGTGNIVEAVRHMRAVMSGIRRLTTLGRRGADDRGQEPRRAVRARALGRRRPASCRCRTSPRAASPRPADAALMMQLGAEAVFVGSGIFKSADPALRAQGHRAGHDPLPGPRRPRRGLRGSRATPCPASRRPSSRSRSCSRPAAGRRGMDRRRPHAARRPPRAGGRRGGRSPARTPSARRRAAVDGGRPCGSTRRRRAAPCSSSTRGPARPGKSAGAGVGRHPGARGCTPQSCGFRDLHREFTRWGFASSASARQDDRLPAEFVERNHVPFEMLSDADLAADPRAAPAHFRVPGAERGGGDHPDQAHGLVRRAGRIERIWYPVFPADRNAETVLGGSASGRGSAGGRRRGEASA